MTAARAVRDRPAAAVRHRVESGVARGPTVRRETVRAARGLAGIVRAATVPKGTAARGTAGPADPADDRPSGTTLRARPARPRRRN